MRVHGAPWTGAVQAGRTGPRAAAGFAPSGAEAEAPASTARASSLGALSSLEALLALQETLNPLERRRRAVGRAGRILDVLDELKLASLDDGGDAAGVLTRLQAAVREARAETEDPALEEVLEQIELRAAVELAKRRSGRS